jgi:hypothetical protein
MRIRDNEDDYKRFDQNPINKMLQATGSPGYKNKKNLRELIRKNKCITTLLDYNISALCKQQVHCPIVLDDTIMIARLSVGSKINIDYEDNGELISKNSIFLISKKSQVVPSFLDFAPYPGRKSLWVRPSIFENTTVVSTREFCKKEKLDDVLQDIIQYIKENKGEKWKLSTQASVLTCLFSDYICQTQDFTKMPNHICIPSFDKQTTKWDADMVIWCWNEAVKITDVSNIDQTDL